MAAPTPPTLLPITRHRGNRPIHYCPSTLTTATHPRSARVPCWKVDLSASSLSSLERSTMPYSTACTSPSPSPPPSSSLSPSFPPSPTATICTTGKAEWVVVCRTRSTSPTRSTLFSATAGPRTPSIAVKFFMNSGGGMISGRRRRFPVTSRSMTERETDMRMEPPNRDAAPSSAYVPSSNPVSEPDSPNKSNPADRRGEVREGRRKDVRVGEVEEVSECMSLPIMRPYVPPATMSGTKRPAGTEQPLVMMASEKKTRKKIASVAWLRSDGGWEESWEGE
ncbi:unnamed protein product [Closterium sp. NIES-54]